MTASCHRLDHASYCDAVAAEIARVASVVADADSETPVSTCGEWTIAGLARHIGGVHRWAGTMVSRLAADPVSPRNVDLDLPADAGGMPTWLASGAERLVPALRAQDPEATMWAWGADPHVRFWSRRMLHETTVHRSDAELALGREPGIDSSVAVDGIDEFLDNLPRAVFFAPGVAELRGAGETLGLRCPEESWLITLGSEGFAWEHGSGEATVMVEGSAPDLYLFAWGRRKATDDGRFSVSGDRDLLARWVTSSAI